MANCADCKGKPCRRGMTEGRLPDCPCGEYSKEEMLSMYSEEELRMATASARVEAEGYGKNTRVEEVMDYAWKLGYKKIGVAFCVGLSAEAATFVTILRSNGFEVRSVCCKNCSISKQELGIAPDQYAHPGADFEPMCNPVGQAKVLDDEECDFVVLLGLCVGHDTLFIRHIKAPCTVLAVKDRALAHNPIGALYTANSYMRRLYSFIKNKYGKE